MGNCYAGLACEFAKKQIGKTCGKSSEFARELDSISFYNTKKNGYANSCKIFVDDCVLNACTDPTPDEDIDCAKWTALYMVCEPQNTSINEGAGCAQAVRYFQENDCWETDTSKFERGDEIFYRSDEYVSSKNPLGVYHTGIIVDWGSYDEGDGFIVVEGNTDGGIVNDHFVSFGDSRIAGAGRIRYDAWLPSSGNDNDSEPEPTPIPEPVPIPKPEPKPEPKIEKYKVHTNGGVLRLRSAPNTDSMYLIGIPNGTTLQVNEVVEGEMISWNTDWAHTTYKGYTGYASCAYLDKE